MPSQSPGRRVGLVKGCATAERKVTVMKEAISRREFMRLAAAGGALCVGGSSVLGYGAPAGRPGLISPGCRTSKVKVSRVYLGVPEAHYPNPDLDLKKEVAAYQSRFAKLQKELADVEFVVDELVSSVDDVRRLADRLKESDGILVIHLTLWIMPMLNEILAMGRPTMVFSVPYSGHEWYDLSFIRREELGKKMECILTTDYNQLAAAIRPFRAIHHLREAKILNLTTGSFAEYAEDLKAKFGTAIKKIELQQVLDAYDAVSNEEAKAETERWIRECEDVVEPSKEEIFKSCKLALAFERLLNEEEATVMTVDCYGSMCRKTPAYPCIGFTRLNDMGLGGICQSDLPCAMIHILFQGLVGRPGFVNNPTFDFSTNTATLIHCLGTRKMDGPDGPSAPYKLRSVMERREGAVPQVKMRVGQKVTQAILDGTSSLRYFTGEIIDTPETNRGCRTKITVKIDGDAERLWRNWGSGIHRVTCYGDIRKELGYFSRFQQIRIMDEAG
jgi:hypothetical protein